MVQNLIVVVIVAASAWYAAGRYLPASWRGRKAAAKAAGCGSGCDTCNACAEPAPPSPTAQRVIKIHPR
ncbi:MAG: FeoB-associated Cys-rich membrane protein [Massilia sp.]